jgi:hypothetical protein
MDTAVGNLSAAGEDHVPAGVGTGHSLVCEIPEFHGFPKVEGNHREAKYNPKQDSHFGTQAVYDTPVCLFVQPDKLKRQSVYIQ